MRIQRCQDQIFWLQIEMLRVHDSLSLASVQSLNFKFTFAIFAWGNGERDGLLKGLPTLKIC